MMSPPLSSSQQTYVDHVAAARAGSPAFDKVCPQISLLNDQALTLYAVTCGSTEIAPEPGT